MSCFLFNAKRDTFGFIVCVAHSADGQTQNGGGDTPAAQDGRVLRACFVAAERR